MWLSLARAPALGAGGRKFESCHPDLKLKSKILCGCSSMVEHQPSKLDTWVRFPSPAFFVSGKVVQSIYVEVDQNDRFRNDKNDIDEEQSGR